MNTANVQYIVDETGRNTGVIVPIELWDEILSESETAYLLKSETMRGRLLQARQRKEGIPFEKVREDWRIGDGALKYGNIVVNLV